MVSWAALRRPQPPQPRGSVARARAPAAHPEPGAPCGAGGAGASQQVRRPGPSARLWRVGVQVTVRLHLEQGTAPFLPPPNPHLGIGRPEPPSLLLGGLESGRRSSGVCVRRVLTPHSGADLKRKESGAACVHLPRCTCQG